MRNKSLMFLAVAALAGFSLLAGCVRRTAPMAWASRLEGAPAIVHAQDWQAALVPSYLHFLRPEAPYWHKTKTVLTIHNLAFQGRFASRLFWDSGLPKAAWNMHFRETVNVTLGLPFVRTSVGHGTAFDLVGTDRASTASLAAAIELARKLAG